VDDDPEQLRPEQLRSLNDESIAACRAGSRERLRAILDEDLRYLDGDTGEPWDQARYAADLRADLRADPPSSLRIDELVSHVAGHTATVSARTCSDAGPSRADRYLDRYLDAYTRRGGRWLCVHACVWPWPAEPDGGTAR
jgi:hypothetical protein